MALPPPFPAGMSQDTAANLAYRTWMCVVCGFIYDEAAGLPEEGIPPGTSSQRVAPTMGSARPQCGAAAPTPRSTSRSRSVPASAARGYSCR